MRRPLELGVRACQYFDPEFKTGEVNEYEVTSIHDDDMDLDVILMLDQVEQESVSLKNIKKGTIVLKLEKDGVLSSAEAAGDNSDSLLSYKIKDFATEKVGLKIIANGVSDSGLTIRNKNNDSKILCNCKGAGILKYHSKVFNEV